jgi:flavorubredoxin
MHGSTLKMVEYLSDRLIEKNLSVRMFNLTHADTGDITSELVDAATLVMASPMVLIGPHPAAVYATYLVNAIRPKLKHMAIIGSYGWGGKILEYAQNLLTNIKPEMLPPVLVKGLPRPEDLAKLDELADLIETRHQQFK